MTEDSDSGRKQQDHQGGRHQDHQGGRQQQDHQGGTRRKQKKQSASKRRGESQWPIRLPSQQAWKFHQKVPLAFPLALIV